jgi:dihydrofolate reductase
MANTVLYMSMSVDGFITGPNVRPDNGLGDGGERLHEWVFAEEPGAVNRGVMVEFMQTGAVVAGRATFEPAEGWGGDHHDGVPIYILSRHPKPDWTADWPLVHYMDDLGEIVAEAKAAAGERNVMVHGSSIAQRMVRAGLLDEMQIHVIPVLLGDGVSLFGHLGLPQRELELVRCLPGEGGVTHLRYRFIR